MIIYKKKICKQQIHFSIKLNHVTNNSKSKRQATITVKNIVSKQPNEKSSETVANWLHGIDYMGIISCTAINLFQQPYFSSKLAKYVWISPFCNSYSPVRGLITTEFYIQDGNYYSSKKQWFTNLNVENM